MSHSAIRTIVAIACVLLLPYANSLALAQSFAQFYPRAAPVQYYPQGAPTQYSSQAAPPLYSSQAASPPYSRPQNVQPQLLGPDELDNLVAPIALYPDPLLSQVLAASTYPLEIVEAQQWLQQNRNLQGQALITAAKQQNWDPSVQLLVAFPDVMALFSRDVRWTTDLGNAFLAQQADVMDAIQRLRARASNNGRLATTPQQIVTTETQNDQSAIQIQPADPQVIYPPVYNPTYVWGPPVSGAYPAVYYPQGDYGSGYAGGPGYASGPGYGGDYAGGPGYGGGYGGGGYGGGSGFGNGFSFGNAINLAGLFSGLLGWGGWGWVLSWFTHTLSLNGWFFSGLFGSHNFGGGYNGGYNLGGGYGVSAIWAHNPAHRLGVPYSGGFLAARYHGADAGGRFSSPRTSAASFAPSRFGGSSFAGSDRTAGEGWRTPASSSAAWRGFQSGNRAAESYNRGGAPTYRSGFASNGGGYSQNYRNSSIPASSQMASGFRSGAPSARNSAPVSHFAAPRMSSQNFSSQNFSSKNSSPRQNFSMPRVSAPRASSSHFSAPHFSAPRGSSHFSAPRHSGGGHSGGGHSSKGSHKH